MKKILAIVGVILLLFVGAVAIAAMSAMKQNGSKSSIYATDEEVQAAVQQMGNDLLAGEMYIDDKLYQLPIEVQELIGAGWTFDENIKKNASTLSPNTVTNTINLNKADAPKKLLTVTLVNPYEEKMALEDVYVMSISPSKISGNKIILPQGITWASTVEEVEAAYGEPAKKSVNDLGSIQRTFLTYENEIISVKFTFDAENGEATKMTGVGYHIKY